MDYLGAEKPYGSRYEKIAQASYAAGSRQANWIRVAL